MSAALVLVALEPLILFVVAGLVVMNTGLGRTRSAAHSMLAAMAAISTASLVYGLPGFYWTPGSTLRLLLQIFAVSVAALIPLSAGADRWRMSASCISTALLAGGVYPLFAHWTWGGGWLARMGFLDAAGAGVIQVVGGLTALNIVWIIGPRRGEYAGDGLAPAIPGHNIVYVLFGALLLLPGWIALNAAGAMLFAAAPVEQMPLIAMNSVLSAAAGCLTALLITRLRYGKPDASLCANGWVSGLVASSAVCALVNPPLAVMVGLIAGGLATASVELLERSLSVDDPGGAISVHAVAGIWGLLAVGLVTRGHWLAQIVGVSTLLGVVLPLSYGLNWLLNRVMPQRTSREGERLGMDLHELGAGAYPEFMIHNDEFMER